MGFVDAITKAVAEEDSLPSESIRRKIVKGYRSFLAPTLANQLTNEVGSSRQSVFPRIKKSVFSLKYKNPARKILRKLYHKFQDMAKNSLRPRPITRSSQFYEEVQPVLNFLTSTGKDQKFNHVD